MLRMTIVCCAVVAIFSLGLGGCNWMGRTTGQAVRNMEDGAQEFQRGYDAGHARDSDAAPRQQPPQSGSTTAQPQ